MNRFNFLTHKYIFRNVNTINLKIFCNHGGIYRFRKKFKKDSGEINPLGVHRNMRVCILEIHCEGLGWLRVEIIFRKERTSENGGLILK